MTISTYKEFIKPIGILYKNKMSATLGYLISPLGRKYEVKYNYFYGVSIFLLHTCNGDSLEAYYFIKDYLEPIYGYSWQPDKRVYNMQEKVRKGELYKIDSQEVDSFEGEYTWLERIEFINEKVCYTEEYVKVPTSEVDFMILEGSILTNY